MSHILIVDDNQVNRRLLARALGDRGHRTSTAADGEEALAMLRADPEAFDLVLLDVLMPRLDGYEVLAAVKGDPALRELPVIMITAVDELDSAVHCIELGATDYLHKPFKAALLHARVGTSLAAKHLRDQERAYLQSVTRVTVAAAEVEAGDFDPASLTPIAARSDELGQLARVFQHMATEIYARERRLRLQIEQLRLDVEERRQASGEDVSVYVPIDRRLALARGEELPAQSLGAILIADISGFTPLTEALAMDRGLQRGAEELTRRLNRIYAALIREVDAYGGSVITFTGDAITCWFPEAANVEHRSPLSAASRALTCAAALQRAIVEVGVVATLGGPEVVLALKVAVVAGQARRMLVGDPAIQQLELLAGEIVDILAAGEHLARSGEILAHESALKAAGCAAVGAWRTDPATGARFAPVTVLEPAPPAPWPAVAPGQLNDERLRPWLLASVYERVGSGRSVFLSELRPAAALFLAFGGVDHEGDPQAREHIHAFTCWVQGVLARYDAALLQLSLGEKGSYLYAVFGAPVAHENDALRAVRAALELRAPPRELEFITEVRIGVSYGQMRAGAYGGPTRRTYGVLGDKTNLAARLMQAADDILCDEAVYELARAWVAFVALPPLMVKGKARPVAVYRPVAEQRLNDLGSTIDRLEPEVQLTLKVASVIGPVFTETLLRAIHPVVATPVMATYVAALNDLGLLVPVTPEGREPAWAFADASVHELVYSRLLYAQRRQLHRAAAKWYEAAGVPAVYGTQLAHHWVQAEEPARAVRCLEQAAQAARSAGDSEAALHYLRASLELSAREGVLGDDEMAPGNPEELD